MNKRVKVYLKAGNEIDIKCSTLTECKNTYEYILTAIRGNALSITTGEYNDIFIKCSDIIAVKIFW
jgi:hypothetical protein